MTAFPHRATGGTPIAEDLDWCPIFRLPQYGFFAFLVDDWLLDILSICRCN
jgi:hypothetical protein